MITMAVFERRIFIMVNIVPYLKKTSLKDMKTVFTLTKLTYHLL